MVKFLKCHHHIDPYGHVFPTPWSDEMDIVGTNS